MKHLTAYVFTTKGIVYHKQPILRVIYDNDGDWQFLSRNDTLDIKDAILVSLDEILQIDNSLFNVVFSLNKGEIAFRVSIGSQWVINAHPKLLKFCK